MGVDMERNLGVTALPGQGSGSPFAQAGSGRGLWEGGKLGAGPGEAGPSGRAGTVEGQGLQKAGRGKASSRQCAPSSPGRGAFLG